MLSLRSICNGTANEFYHVLVHTSTIIPGHSSYIDLFALVAFICVGGTWQFYPDHWNRSNFSIKWIQSLNHSYVSV